MLWRLVFDVVWESKSRRRKRQSQDYLQSRHPVISCSLLTSDRDWSLRHSGQQQTCRTITFPRFRNKEESFTVGQWFIFLFSPGFMWLTNHDSSLNSLSSVTWNVSLYESSLWRQDKTRKLLFIDIRGKWRYLWSWKRPIYVLRFSHAFLSLSFFGRFFKSML